MWINKQKSCLLILLLLVLINGCENTDLRESPYVLRTTPIDGDNSISRTPVITIYFSEDLDPVTVNNNSINFSEDIDFSISVKHNIITVTPQTILGYETTYTIFVNTTIRDLGGKTLEKQYSWSFTTVPRPPFISSVSPTNGPVGTLVNINGFGFATNSALNTVRFNGTLAEIISSTPTQIVTKVPFGATSGPIKISSATGNSIAPTLFTVTQPGIQWIEVSSGTDNTLRSVCWATPRFIAVGDHGTILTSTDGFNWVNEIPPSQHTLFATSSTPGNAYTVGSGGSMFYSRNNSSWVEVDTEIKNNFFDMCINSQLRIVIGSSGTILVSKNDQKWEMRKSPINAWFYGITQFKSNYYVVGSNGALMWTLNGINWEEKNSGTHEHLLAIDTSSTQLIAVGYNGTILTSLNGNIWVKQQSNVTNHLSGSIYTGEEIIVVGEHGCILFSDNGEIWDVQTPPTDKDLYDIAWSGSILVAIGEKGTIIVSQ